MPVRVPDEHTEQVHVIQWLKLKKIKHNATPNGGLRNKVVAGKLKAEGVSKGFPDLTIFLPTGILYIEMKRKKGSSISPEQKAWIEYLNTLPYAKAIICKGFREAVEAIEDKMKGNT